MASLERALASAHSAHTLARRALAIALAEEGRETERRTMLAAKVEDLEKRAIEALRAGRDDLGLQAAETIAALTTDINASERASERFAAEVALARREVDAQRRRLSELDRGRRLARIGSALNGAASDQSSGLDSLTEAEAALAQVVADNQNGRFVREEMAPPAERLIERLSDAGFGQSLQVRASEVLAHLRDAAGLPSSHLIESTRTQQ
jgi:phage shock protein A